MNKQLFFIVFSLLAFSDGFSQTMGMLPEQKHSENAGIFQSDPDLPIMGPSFEVFACKMRSKSMSRFVETYNQANTGQLVESMQPLGTMIGIRYGYSFSYQNSRDLFTIIYIGQQINKGSLEAKLIDGYTRRIDYTQKNVLDLAMYFPLNRFLYIGGKMAWTTQTLDTYRMYGEDRVYDEQSYITGVYRTSLGNFTAGLEVKANFTLFKRIIISPSIAYQTTFGNSDASYFVKGSDQWGENSSTNTYYFPSDYNGYLSAISNYTTLPAEGLLKPRNRMVMASVSVLINLGGILR